MILFLQLAGFLQTKEAQIVLALTGMTMVVLVGYYIVSKVRSNLHDQETPPTEMISNFRELHSQGELSDEEYRTIKTMLGARLQAELKEKEKEG
jgi:uncharacterized membrane protein